MEEDIKYIELILKGETAMFAKLVDKYQNYVFSIVSRIVLQREEAEEAAQDVFVKVFKQLKNYRHDAKFTTWLFRIARNTAIDYSRKKKRNTTSIDDDDSYFQLRNPLKNSPLNRLQSQQRAYYIEKIINKLPQQDALLISLYYLKEHSIEEIANIEQLTATNVKVKLFRLRKKLKKELEVLLNIEARELL